MLWKRWSLTLGGYALTWFLLFTGLLLFGLGLWGGPRPRRWEEAGPAEEPSSAAEALEILSQPLPREAEEELIRIPEGRPWYLPDRRFQQGLLTGLGAGLLVAAAAIAFLPREPLTGPPGDVAHRPPAAQDPAGPQPPRFDTAPGDEPGGGTVGPPGAPDPEPKPEPPRPVNVTFVVEPGELAPDIARKLDDEGLIADEEAFLRRVEERGVDRFLKAGTFVIPTDASLDEVIDALTP